MIQFDNVVLSADYKVNPLGWTKATGFTSGIKPRTDNKLKFLNGSKLFIDPNREEHYSILTLNSVNDVKIIDALVYGDVENHIGTSGESNCPVHIAASASVVVIGKGGKAIDEIHRSNWP